MSEEYKRFDSDCTATFVCPRIATDPTVKKSAKGDPLVRFKVVAERASKDKDGNYRFEPLWLEVNVGSYNAKAASFLQKGDVLGKVRGDLAMRLWGDNNENQSISLEFAQVTIPPALFKELKERGFSGDGEPNWSDEDAPKGKKGSKKAPPAKGKKAPPPPSSKKKVEIPPDDEEEDDSDLDIPDDEDGEE